MGEWGAHEAGSAESHLKGTDSVSEGVGGREVGKAFMQAAFELGLER